METLGDLLARDRRTDDVAVRAPGAGDAVATYTYEDFVTTGWKTANFFSHRGVHRGATVAVADDPAVAPLLALFGAAQLGAITRFGPPEDEDPALLVAPAARVEGVDVGPGTTRMAYHGDPDDPGVAPFGRSVWSENPVEPPESVAPDAAALATETGTTSHADLLARAGAVAADLDASETVVIRAPLANPGTVVAGVLAPMSVGGTVAFPGLAEDRTDLPGDVAVATVPAAAPEPRVIDPDSV